MKKKEVNLLIVDTTELESMESIDTGRIFYILCENDYVSLPLGPIL